MPWGFERAVISDVLPYELPVAFNNARFAQLLARLDLERTGGGYAVSWLGPSTPVIVSLLFGAPINLKPPSTGRRVEFLDPRTDPAKHPYARARALSFDIGKSAGGVRTVSVMHPRTQLSVAEFYEDHSGSILHFTNRSAFSIRHPRAVARYTVSRDAAFAKDLDEAPTGVEEHTREYNQLRSFFAYGGYSHIYKFYDSAEARKLERRYAWVVHVDVTRCFDSIYTHSVSWVTSGLEDSKLRTSASDHTFGGRFDKLMQSANDLETHGILIGSEVSRIFSEIILQEVDVRVERLLRKSSNPKIHRVHYDIRRFVDDYFIYCANESDAKMIVAALALELKAFKLYLNDAKRRDEPTPLASARSVAKFRVKQAIRRSVEVKGSDDAERLLRLNVSAQDLLLQYKAALLEAHLEHGDLANYALVQLEFSFESALTAWRQRASAPESPQPEERDWTRLVRFISSVLDVAAGIFAGGVSASHSVKLARISHTALKFMDLVDLPHTLRAGVESKIVGELVSHVRRAEHELEPPAHALILIDALASIDGPVALTEVGLRHVLNLQAHVPSAVTLLTGLRFCYSQDAFPALRAELDQLALAIARKALRDGPLETGATLLAGALFDSPFHTSSFKRKLAVGLKVPGNAQPGGHPPLLTFFEWRVPDYYEALQRKRGGDVY